MIRQVELIRSIVNTEQVQLIGDLSGHLKHHMAGTFGAWLTVSSTSPHEHRGSEKSLQA